MSKKLSRSDALEDISTWCTNDVLCLLRKNGLEECCNPVAKRQIDGDGLLHLTEGKLALWKSDLTRPLIRALRNLIEDIKKSPEKFVQEKRLETLQQHEEHLSDTGSWGTDFEDEGIEESETVNERRDYKASEIRNKQRHLQSKEKKNERGNVERMPTDESTYANFDSVQDEDNTYANFQDAKNSLPKNVSRLHGSSEMSLAEQLKEQLKLRSARKPVVRPKPETLAARRIETDPKQPQKSFLHNASKPKPGTANEAQKRMTVPPPPEPHRPKDLPPMIEKSLEKDLSKPPVTIRNLDLVANLPTRTEESEDEYETFDEQVIEQNQKKVITKTDSKQSLNSGRQNSVESVYQPASVTSYEEEEEEYEIYECITETPEDNGYYLSPIQRTMPSSIELPLPLPVKPTSNTPSPTPGLKRMESSKERSPEKKSATLPHTGSSTSLSATERATRPLPPPPDRQSYVDKPWFHNVTRGEAIALIKEQSTYGNPQDGYFLLRPSTTNVNNPLALVLWYKDKVYNVPVRKRPDNRYALGFAKVNERTFSSVEEIVTFYTREELVLHTDGVETGGTKLTNTPTRKSDSSKD